MRLPRVGRSAGGPRALMLFVALVAVSASGASAADADHHPRGTVRAARTDRPPVIDGHLTDEAWQLATPVTDFTQTDPDEGEPATERTEVRVLFDDDAVYVGARLFDRAAAQIVRRLAKRDDDVDADRITLYFDPMHDHLTGLDGLEPRRHAQMLPYVAGRAEFIGAGERGPFNDGSRLFNAGGVDLKWGVTSSITLDATVNPDFGQVEVDPAVVNLTAFETFFEERRPFFLEGAQIFQNFGRSGANNYWGFNSSDPSLFYSRRNGRAPQLRATGDFVDPPSATTIVSAAKVTAKTRRGWSLGLLDAVTDREVARTSSASVLGRSAVEPRSNYIVVRLQRDIGRRAGLGLMATSVTRQLETQALSAVLARQATVVGADGYWFLGPARDWVVNGRLAASRIAGEPAAVARAQRLVQRYFQRPDARQVRFDPSRTALGGYTGRVNLNRNSGLWQVNASLWGVSPGFESNDLGFLGSSDRAGGHLVVLRRSVTPTRVTRSWNVWVAKWWTWNYGRELQGDGVQSNAFLTFRNYWTVGTGGGLEATCARRSADSRRRIGDRAGRRQLERQSQLGQPSRTLAPGLRERFVERVRWVEP